MASNTCKNNLLDDGETDIDCGGYCLPCESGKVCLSDFDCQSAYCQDGICQPSNQCGNNEWNIGEQCDGSTDSTCSLFGFEGGTLNCNDICSLDTSQCIGPEGICGDGIINPGEQCDGTNLPDIQCFNFGDYQSGQLSCQDCKLALDRCTTELNPLQDTDNDGMPDACELKYFNCRTCADADADPDNDGLTNKQECSLCSRKGTDPHQADTDKDGFSDSKEVKKGTSPCDPNDYPSSSLTLIFIILFILLALLGIGYFLYSKKAITFSKVSPYIIWNKNIKSMNDLFKGPEPEEKVLNHSQFKPPQTQQLDTQTQQELQPLQKQVSVRKIVRERKRKSLFESFEDQSLKITKLPERKTTKPIKKMGSIKPIKTTPKKQQAKTNSLDKLPHSKSKKKLFKEE
ncbi:hypothetical protein KAU11_07405 [Candidatus Babeliales bacterium]|nr:hypothetical protein [Candidatus Babeliales bacterium]